VGSIDDIVRIADLRSYLVARLTAELSAPAGNAV
jgi:hypothetical protein